MDISLCKTIIINCGRNKRKFEFTDAEISPFNNEKNYITVVRLELNLVDKL